VGGAKIRVLVVDDSPFMRRAVQRMLEPSPDLDVVGAACDGREAVEQVKRLRPDVVVLDIVMPEVDGLEAIREIMEVAPTPILVLSTETRPGTEVTLRALERGAVDFISKGAAGTRMDIYDLAPILREKVRVIAGSRVRPSVPPASQERTAAARRVETAGVTLSPAAPYDVVVVGASTGGPRALATLLAALPADFPAGILLAQHMPAGFTATLAERLDRRSRLTVREAVDGMRIEPGVALLGVGGRHLEVERGADGLVARVRRPQGDVPHSPSVDVLFTSAVEAAGSRAIGVVLTGMGNDGARGLAAIRQAGGRTLAESEESAVIFGMPRAAREAAERMLPLQEIPAALVRLFHAGAR
jgi:two-component system, chemotaxis family, protein-glutamate methylesterase/glutaminase